MEKHEIKSFGYMFCSVLVLFFVPAQLLAGEDVFARQGDMALTQQEIDAAFAQVPQQQRMAVIRDGGKVDEIVQSLLRYKQLAQDAREKGYADDPVVQARLALVADKELAEAWVQHLVNNAPEADYEAMAQEYYIANRERFVGEESVDVTHILVGTMDGRSDEEAFELAGRIHGELLADPALFDEYVETYSDDPGKAENMGRYTSVRRGQMVKPFEDTAFAMEQAGEISEPVKTDFGYHIIRLDGKTAAGPLSFEDVKPELVEQMRKEHLSNYRRNYILSVSSQDIALEEGAVEKMLKRHFGENLELAPDLYNR
jgi:peptidyl-prolyl cis-trans isomerase C